MEKTIQVYYEIITEESCEQGDAEERGEEFLFNTIPEKNSLHEALQNILEYVYKGNNVEWSSSPPSIRDWVTVYNEEPYLMTFWPSRYRTCQKDTIGLNYSIHLKGFSEREFKALRKALKPYIYG